MANADLLILRNAQVLAPEPLGLRDLVLAGERIVAVAERGVEARGLACEELDLEGRIVAPGFIDNHVHVLGGGGGLGFASRAPELQTSQLARVGTTTVFGMLGHHPRHARARRQDQGVPGGRDQRLALTGATLEHPVPTLIGRIGRHLEAQETALAGEAAGEQRRGRRLQDVLRSRAAGVSAATASSP